MTQSFRFDRHNDRMLGRGHRYTITKGDKVYQKIEPNTGSKDREAFLAFRKNWKRGYTAIVEEMRHAKAFIQANKTEHALTADSRRILQVNSVIARSMMMALEAIKVQSDFDKKKNVNRLIKTQNEQPAREKVVPSQAQIEKWRAEKKEKLNQLGSESLAAK
jgi:hypothetical protein